MLGLLKGSVRLAVHDEGWKEHYQQEEKILRSLVNDWIIDIQHVGSTAVNGLVAKPIIDMVMGIKELGEAEHFRDLLEAGGFIYRPNASTEERIFFNKGTENLKTHHLHVVEYGGNEWKTLTGFRDYLNSHPEALEEYAALKSTLAEKYPTDREAYTAAKNDFIQGILKILEK